MGYMTRGDTASGKAGNLNAALARTESPFVVVFDADHVPTRSFLQVTIGWFLRDAQLGLLQTPHHFYSPDPFERNLGQNRAVPAEDELFYGVVQDGNDFWNATYFCGSCAVLRRRALNEVGGMAAETVTEDAHTSMRMQRLGWNSAYINIPQAAGLATERLSAHVRQRIRWARGMVQILRVENPLFGPGLTFAQRLCYFNSMSHFLYALPRLIFLTAPLMFLIFGYTILPGYWAAILAYAAPHLVLSSVARSRMQGSHRHSFWTEIYETVLAPYLLGPTLAALIRPRGAASKGSTADETVNEEHFDARIARPTLVLLVLNWCGLFCGAARLMQFPSWDVPRWARFVNWPATLYERGHSGTVALYGVWTVFNVVLLGVAAAVAWESLQRRRSVRVETTVPSEVVLADGSKVRGITADLSSGGVRTRMEYDVPAKAGDAVQFVFPVPNGTAVLPAIVVALDGRVLRAKFDQLTLPELEALTMILYARADRWLGWSEGREPDRPFHSFLRILRLAGRGLRQAFFGGPGWRKREGPQGRWETSVVPLVALALLFGGQARGVQILGDSSTAGNTAALKTSGAAAKDKPGDIHTAVTLGELRTGEAIRLGGPGAREVVQFAVPQSLLVRLGTLRLRYRFAPGLRPEMGQLKATLNGTVIATMQVAGAGEQGKISESAIPLPVGLLARSNSLGFEFVGPVSTECDDRRNTSQWSEVDANSAIELTGTAVALDNELSLLPVPFYQEGVTGKAVVPVVFLGTPSAKGMQAAGIVASWIGGLAGVGAVRFPVTVGRIPPGNVVVIGEAGALPASLGVGQGPGGIVALRTNPADAFGKVLLLTGASGDDLVTAATAVAVQRNRLHGAQVRLQQDEMPEARAVDDAPRWLSTDRVVNFGEIERAKLNGDGTMSSVVSLRLPPDLFYGDGAGVAYAEGVRTMPLHLRYRYNGTVAGEGSALEVWVNGARLSEVALPHANGIATIGEAEVGVPVDRLRPSLNKLEVRFVAQGKKVGGCSAGAPSNLSGTVLKDSYLDVQGVPHWTALPNLELFAAAGFPFTRRADLAETAVVLPAEPTAEELELFLTIMGRFGTQTGFPVLRVTVSGPDGMTRDGGKDYLVLGSSEDQPALRMLEGEMPVPIDESGMHQREAAGFFGRSAWWKMPGSGEGGAAELEKVGAMPDGLIEGLEWPRRSRRSVVTVTIRQGAAMPGVLDAFARAAESSEIGQTVSALRGGRWTSYSIGGGVYMVGHLPAAMRARLLLTEFPWLIVLVTVMVCLLVASLLRGILRRGARMRLQGSA